MQQALDYAITIDVPLNFDVFLEEQLRDPEFAERSSARESLGTLHCKSFRFAKRQVYLKNNSQKSCVHRNSKSAGWNLLNTRVIP